LLRQSSKEGVSGVGSKEKTQAGQPSKDVVSDVSGVSGVGISGDTSGESADYRNEKSKASGIGAQKFMIIIQIQIILISFGLIIIPNPL
jgi:hypothetical protein